MFCRTLALAPLLFSVGACSGGAGGNPDAAPNEAPDATLECEPGQWGPSCESACDCANGGTCNDGRMGTGSCTCAVGWSGDRCEVACSLDWGTRPDGPIETFSYDNVLPGILWNDPTVLKVGATYHMWLTGGDPLQEEIPVLAYKATSDDGINWKLDTTPVLSPGAEGEWDDRAVETLSVIVDGDGLYHLYYSGRRVGAGLSVLEIGHATSTDGDTWTKDPNNPVISTVESPETSDWGVFSVAEPAAVYDPNADEIRLYYVSAGGSAEHDGDFAILLATSSDGSVFTHHRDSDGNREPVWSLQNSYTPTVEFRGYSTPSVALGADGHYYLVHDVVKYVDGSGFDQMAISLARSADGVHFEELSINILARGQKPWFEQLIGPTILLDGDDVRIWFTGHEELTSFDDFTHGIGQLTGTFDCNL